MFSLLWSSGVSWVWFVCGGFLANSVISMRQATIIAMIVCVFCDRLVSCLVNCAVRGDVDLIVGSCCL